MSYVISDGEHYIRDDNNVRFIVNDLYDATKWKHGQQAQKVQRNLNKELRKSGFQVRKIESCMTNKQTEPVELGFDILEKAEEIETLTKQAENRMTYLNEQIRQVDLSIVDIEHAAEFYNLNAAQGYNLYKMLHDARIKRRELKNEREKIQYFLSSKTNTNGMENLKNHIIGMEHKKYKPRVINELFGV